MALGTYNRTAYNRLGPPRQFRAGYRMEGALELAAAPSLLITVQYFAEGALDAYMDLWWGYREPYGMSGALDAEAALRIAVPINLGMAGEMEMDARQALAEPYRMEGELSAAAPLNFIILPKATLTGSLTVRITGAQERRAEMVFEDLVIPPGSVLVIDTESYIITLDNENAIDRYEGDWFCFTPDLLGLEVTSGTSGSPEVRVLYREMFL